jgi:AcrR family transcriptional regulator
MSTETPPPRVTKAAQSEATRAKLLLAARQLFGARGYAAVGTEEVVRAAGVTRGALYHQFADKRALFSAVFEELEGELIASAAARMAEHPHDMVAAFKAACRGWLEACARPEAEQIVLLDAPAVLGWEAWREIGERYGLGVVMASLEAGMEAGALARQPVRPLAHVLVGALDEAALYVARADDREAALAETDQIIDRLIGALV